MSSYEEVIEQEEWLWGEMQDYEFCDHPWHENPGLIIPCPECGEEE